MMAIKIYVSFITMGSSIRSVCGSSSDTFHLIKIDMRDLGWVKSRISIDTLKNVKERGEDVVGSSDLSDDGPLREYKLMLFNYEVSRKVMFELNMSECIVLCSSSIVVFEPLKKFSVHFHFVSFQLICWTFLYTYMYVQTIFKKLDSNCHLITYNYCKDIIHHTLILNSLTPWSLM